MKNGAVIELEAAWALNTLEVDEAKTSLCGTKAGADMKDGLRINYIHHNKQVVEKPALSGEGVAFFSGEEKPAGDYEQELFYHIVADGAEQIVKPAQAAVVTRVLEAIYESAKVVRQFILIKRRFDLYSYNSSNIRSNHGNK